MGLVLFDTNILIDHTAGIIEATRELSGYDDAAISAINWMEVACALTPAQIDQFEQDLMDAGVAIVQTSVGIMRRAAEIRGGKYQRQGTKAPKLPDCIIWATADLAGRLIITRDPDGFGGRQNPHVRVPYKNTHGVITDVLPLPE